MTKKYLIRAIVLCSIAAAGISAPKSVKADALPCTVMYLNEATGMQANATAELAAAKANLNEKQAKVDALIASGQTNTQAYFNAATELLAAKGNVEAKQQALTSANSYVKDCKSKYAVEDNADHAYKALQDVNALQAAKLEYDNAQNIATAAANVVDQTKKAIAGYQVQLGVSPAVQSQINALNTQLASQEADLAAKQAVANAKKAVYDKALNSNWASYDKKAIEYIYRRDDMRDKVIGDMNNDGVVDGEDFFIAIGWK